MHVRPLAYDQPEPLGDGMALAILRNELEVLAVPDMPDGGPMGADGVCKLQKLPVLGLCGLSCWGMAIQGYTARVCRPGSRPWTCRLCLTLIQFVPQCLRGSGPVIAWCKVVRILSGDCWLPLVVCRSCAHIL
jgi:hypothetical protein